MVRRAGQKENVTEEIIQGLSSFVISTLQWELGEGLERKITGNNEATVSWQISI